MENPSLAQRRGKVLIWGENNIEPQTVAQAARSADLPFVMTPVALMPDAHIGKGATIGSVIATRGAVIPAAVGVDIGCGMIAARLNVNATQLPDNLGPLHGALRAAIPAGVGQGHEQSTAARDELVEQLLVRAPFETREQKKRRAAADQFGSLGSGNHFVELCLDESDDVWLVLHSGSRGVGNQLATEHIENAKGLMKQYFIELADPDLAYVVAGTPAFDAYIAAMLWAQDYAYANREQMLRAALGAMRTHLHDEVDAVESINCHHNYTEREHHQGEDVWVTRKGAIRARVGDRGVIPGSMGAASFVVSGLGNAASYCSCSHGAGRRLSRSAARRTLTVDSLREQMAGTTWNDREADDILDEHPESYKDIDAVMAAQADLVRVEHRLRQVLNYKGAGERPRGRKGARY